MKDFNISRPDARRLFFALWPDDAVREELMAVQDARLTDGKRIPRDNLHLTLAFLGNVSADAEQCLIEAARKTNFLPFELVLDQLGYFARPQILWIGSTGVPPELSALLGGLNKIISNCLPAWQPNDFKAHVTLARRASRQIPQSQHPIFWSCTDFCLVSSQNSDEGSNYEVVQRFSGATPASPVPSEYLR